MVARLIFIYLFIGEFDIPRMVVTLRQPDSIPEQNLFNLILNEINGMANFPWFLHRVKQDLDKQIQQIIGSWCDQPKTAVFTEYETWYFR